MGHGRMWITFHCSGTQVCVLSINISKVRQDKDPSSVRTLYYVETREGQAISFSFPNGVLPLTLTLFVEVTIERS